MKVVILSGGFDGIHEGHIRYIKDAAKLGMVFILLNSDSWLMRKKGYIFQKFDARREILMAMGDVNGVYEVDDSDDTVCDGLKKLRNVFSGPGIIFAKGGDRTADNTPEQEVCKQLGIEVIFGVGGDKVASSSELVAAVRKHVSTALVHEDAR